MMPVFLARQLPGTVGETRRVVHVFPVPPEGEMPSRLAAFCGAGFGRGELEMLEELSGMPCVSCLRDSPTAAELTGGL
jgi:hypothetical protein